MTAAFDITLHPLTEEDRDLILRWRNDPVVRRNMYSHHEISPEEHRAWFERMNRDPSARWYLGWEITGEPAGVVYFTQIDGTQRTAFWGFYAKPEAKPGVGLRMEYRALELAFEKLNLHKLNCEVLARNTAVINLHKKCGFTQEGVFREQHFDGEQYVDVVRLGLLAYEWSIHKNQLQNRVNKIRGLAAQHRPPSSKPVS